MTGVFDGILTVFVGMGINVGRLVENAGSDILISFSVGRMTEFETEQPEQNNTRQIKVLWMRTFHEKGIK